MIREKTIQLTRLNNEGQEELVDVQLRYCAATEIGFSGLTDHQKTVEVFNPTIEMVDGQAKVTAQPKATDDDYIRLVMAAIIAAYEARSTDTETVEPPLTMKDLILRSTRKQIMDAVNAVLELRMQWLDIPSAIKPETEETEEKQKNVATPTTSTK